MASASSSFDGPPEANAAPDNQGNLGFCSKTVGNGFMDKKFKPFRHQQLDFVQSDISTALVNADKVLCCFYKL